MTDRTSLIRNQSGATAAEFTLVLPLLILFLLGLIDAGRFIWEYNRAEKATQMGVRFAVATAMVPGEDFADYSFSIDGGLPQGSAVPIGEFESATCDESGCECTGGDVCDEVAHDPDAFQNIVDRMAAMHAPITAGMVEVEYRNVGLGYAGDPNGPDVVPLVTVRLIPGANGLKFQPLSTMIFGADIEMPDFRAALTLEDGSGTVAN